MRLLWLVLAGPLVAQARLLAPLKSVLSFYGRNPVSDNFLFGVLLAEAQLYATKSINKAVEKELNELIKQCNVIVARNPRYWLNRRIVKRVAKSLSRMKIRQQKLDPPSALPYRLEDNLLHGSPSKGNSSRCIVEAMVGRRVSERCLVLETDDTARGYTLSHQVVYLSIASAMVPTPFITGELLPRKCGKVLSEVNYAWENDIPEDLIDLFVEDVAVCGMNNFKEFLTEPILDYISSLQLDEGCFALSQDSPLKECDEHLSSTALVSLTSFLYTVVESGQYEIL